MLSQPTAIVLLVKLKLSHKSGETADALTALLMSSAKKAFASRCCLDIPDEGNDFFCLQMPDAGNDELLHVNDENYFLFA